MVPYIIGHSVNELINKIEEFDYNIYEINLKNFSASMEF